MEDQDQGTDKTIETLREALAAAKELIGKLHAHLLDEYGVDHWPEVSTFFERYGK